MAAKRERFHLNRSDCGLYVPPMVWREIENFSTNSVCLVLASEFYDIQDYVDMHDDFLQGCRKEDSVKIPFLDMKAPYLELRSELDAAYRRVMESGQYILGEEVEAFEAEFAAYCGVRHCIGVGNGLEALHLILRACGIGPGDEVIVPANTYIATWLAVSYAGATPVPVEPDNRTFNLDPALVEQTNHRTHAGDPAGTPVRSDRRRCGHSWRSPDDTGCA